MRLGRTWSAGLALSARVNRTSSQACCSRYILRVSFAKNACFGKSCGQGETPFQKGHFLQLGAGAFRRKIMSETELNKSTPDWVELFKQCPVPMDDLLLRSRGMNRFELFTDHELLVISEGFDYLDYPDKEQELVRSTYFKIHDELIQEMDQRKLLPIDPDDPCHPINELHPA
jgi:hypothetical protein